MPMSTTERASVAARASHASKTPEQRREHARHAYLAGAMNAIEKRRAELPPEMKDRIRALAADFAADAPPLTPEQISKLRALFAGTRSA